MVGERGGPDHVIGSFYRMRVEIPRDRDQLEGGVATTGSSV